MSPIGGWVPTGNCQASVPVAFGLMNPADECRKSSLIPQAASRLRPVDTSLNGSALAQSTKARPTSKNHAPAQYDVVQ